MAKYIINGPQVISEDTSGETVIINLETGSYFNLNAESSKIWGLLVNGVNIGELKANLEPSVACGKEIADAKIDGFISKLLDEKLIRETENSNSVAGKISVNVNDLLVETYTDMQDLLGLDPIHEVEPEAGWPLAKKS